jgi:hypothetical protein
LKEKSARFSGLRSELGRWPDNLIHDGSDEVLILVTHHDGSTTIETVTEICWKWDRNWCCRVWEASNEKR